MSGRRGFFVVIEGLDGSGTSTQVQLLAERMRSEHPDLPVAVTAEPSSGPAGSLIRQILKGRVTTVTALGQSQPFDRKALALLFAADRLDHVACEIEPLVQAGWLVVSDRYVWSSLAYQSLDAPMEWVAQINRFAPPPDLLIMLNIPHAVGLSRVNATRPGREIFETEEFLAKAEVAYQEAMAEWRATPVCILDGTRSKEDVAEDVWVAVRQIVLKTSSLADENRLNWI